MCTKACRRSRMMEMLAVCITASKIARLFSAQNILQAQRVLSLEIRQRKALSILAPRGNTPMWTERMCINYAHNVCDSWLASKPRVSALWNMKDHRHGRKSPCNHEPDCVTWRLERPHVMRYLGCRALFPAPYILNKSIFKVDVTCSGRRFLVQLTVLSILGTPPTLHYGHCSHATLCTMYRITVYKEYSV